MCSLWSFLIAIAQTFISGRSIEEQQTVKIQTTSIPLGWRTVVSFRSVSNAARVWTSIESSSSSADPHHRSKPLPSESRRPNPRILRWSRHGGESNGHVRERYKRRLIYTRWFVGQRLYSAGVVQQKRERSECTEDSRYIRMVLTNEQSAGCASRYVQCYWQCDTLLTPTRATTTS